VWSTHRPPKSPLRGLEVLEDGVGVPMSDPRFDDEHWIAITCHVSELVRSMSDDGHPGESTFGTVTTALTGDAIAYCPSDLERHVAKGIAAARFWISVSTAGSVCPSAETFATHGLELANPSLVALAERVFGIDFGQTCAWSV